MFDVVALGTALRLLRCRRIRSSVVSRFRSFGTVPAEPDQATKGSVVEYYPSVPLGTSVTQNLRISEPQNLSTSVPLCLCAFVPLSHAALRLDAFRLQ